MKFLRKLMYFLIVQCLLPNTFLQANPLEGILGKNILRIGTRLIKRPLTQVYEKGPEKMLAPFVILKESTAEDLKNQGIEKAIIQRAVVPSQYRVPVSPVKNQDCLGTCVSFAVGGEIERHLLSQQQRISEAHFTVQVEQTDDGIAGLNLAKGMGFARDKGFVSQAYWSYEGYLQALCQRHNVPYERRWDAANKDKLNNAVIIPSPVSDGSVPHFKFSKVLYVYQKPRQTIVETFKTHKDITPISSLAASPITDLRTLIANNATIVVSVPVWWKTNGVDAGWESGRIKVPSNSSLKLWSVTLENESDPKKKGWHAILLNGYNDTGDDRGGYFIFKNSWGPWGTNGFGTIPYTYIERFSDFGTYGQGLVQMQ